MSDLRRERGRGRRPVRARLPGDQRAVGVRSGERVMLDRRRRSGPLPVDSLAAFIDEHRRIAFPRVKLGERVRDHDLVRISPRTRADAVARVGRLIAVRHVVFDAQIGAPCSRPFSDSGSEPLACCVGTGKATEVGGDARRARDEKAHAGRRGHWRRCRRRVFVAAACGDERK